MKWLSRIGWMLMAGMFVWRLWRRANPVDLRGKVVVVTGASAGIGKATAAAFAAEGARVVLVARRAELLEQVKAEITARYPVEVLAYPADLTQEADLHTLVSTVEREFGRIDVLINNAGLSMGGALHENDPDALERMITLNFTSLVKLTQLVLPGMLARLSGHIVNVSSIAGELRAPGLSAYAATKAAVNGLSDALRRELQGTGVHITKIMPGWTATDMIDGMNVEAMRRVRLIWEPLMVLETAESVAQEIVDAVRYKKAEVTRGGLGYLLAVNGARISPDITDLVYQFAFNRDEMVQVMRDAG